MLGCYGHAFKLPGFKYIGEWICRRVWVCGCVWVCGDGVGREAATWPSYSGDSTVQVRDEFYRLQYVLIWIMDSETWPLTECDSQTAGADVCHSSRDTSVLHILMGWYFHNSFKILRPRIQPTVFVMLGPFSFPSMLISVKSMDLWGLEQKHCYCIYFLWHLQAPWSSSLFYYVLDGICV